MPFTNNHYTYLHKSKQSPKIKPKALKSSLPILRQVPFPNGNQTIIQETYSANTTKTF